MPKQIFKVFSIFAIVLMASNAQARVAFSSGTLYYGSIVADGVLKGVGGNNDHRLLTTVPAMYILGECANSQGNNDGGVVGAAFVVNLGAVVGDVEDPTTKNGKTPVSTTHELPDPNNPDAIAEFFPDACDKTAGAAGFTLVSYSIVSFDVIMRAQTCATYAADGFCLDWNTVDTLEFMGCDGPAGEPGDPILGCND